ncbi:carbohydrate binding domain-containing protein [Paenibacillus koleovorans]|uniref:carbohydrate binding domain-containing protein n=1 Tax=Paenibacillus koleovorans TaxID=121608 RepID=UPI0013E3F4AA|nr:carbohydrate binding domain-containing protein [Paenibacillus koleovorans]
MRSSKRNKWFLSWLMLMLIGTSLSIAPMASANNTNYYVDCSAGSNGSGTIGSPWNTLSSVNSHAAFQPGDQILLKKGTSCTGQLAPQGSGSSGSPITIDSYGSGAAPIINGAGVTATIYLFNQQYWIIQNLEVTNISGTVANRSGIKVLNNGGGTLNYIRILNNNIHNVDGSNGRGTGGIVVHASTGAGDKYNGVLISGNTVTDVDRDGIIVIDQNWQTAGQKSTDVTVTQNTVTRAGADSILLFGVDGGSIDHNTGSYGGQLTEAWIGGFWVTRSDNVVIEYNEYYSMQMPIPAAGDSEGFDVDLSVNNAVVQFNYSHDNTGGGYLICAGAVPGETIMTDNVTVRYNISQNDLGHGPLAFSGYSKATNLHVYNNTFYLGSSVGSTNVITSYAASYTNPSAAWTFKNNIIYNLGSGGYVLPGTGHTFDYNVFYGNHPASEPSDAHKSTADPLFLAPGTGGIGRNTVDGYKLKTGSPALGSGVAIASGSDYWGNPVSGSTAPNRGAYNGPGTDLLFNPDFEKPQWTPSAATITQVTTDKNSGERGMKASSRTQLFSAATQIVTDQLLANGQGTYNYSAWAKFAGSSSTAFVILWVQDGAGTHWYNASSTSVGTSSFTQLTGSANVTWTAPLIKAQLYVQTDSSLNDIYTDDYSLTKGGGPNLISNPGMEELQWYGNGATLTHQKTDVHGGSYGMTASSRTQVWSSVAINVKGLLDRYGKGTYDFSAWAKLASGSDTAFVILKIDDGAGSHWYNPAGTTINTSGFTKLSHSANVTWTGAITSAILYVQTDNSKADLHVDDYSLIKK